MTVTSERPPELRRALARLRRRLRNVLGLQGLALAAGTAGTLLLAHYGLDRLLLPPVAVRLVLLALVLGVIGFVARRHLLVPLRHRLADEDLALLVERREPDLHQVFVSAVEGSSDTPRPGSPALWAEVVRRGAERIASLELRGLPPRRRLVACLGFATVSLVCLATVLGLDPEGAGVWWRRFLGADLPYPRRTFLKLSVPPGAGNYRFQPDPSGGGVVHIARGADLPVVVEARGEVPPQVLLRVAGPGGESSWPAPARGGSRFRYVFRRVLEGFSVRAEGGDDPGTAPILVQVHEAPAAVALKARIQPPAYTGRPPREQEGGLIEALPGSRIELSFRVTAPVAEAALVFEEEGRTLPLDPAAPPHRPGESAGSPGGPSFVARFAMPEHPDRYRIRLVGRNGLRERHPERHALIPLPDRPPRVRIMFPAGGLDAFLPSVPIPLRLAVQDDFGLTAVHLQVFVGRERAGRTRALWTRDSAKAPPRRLSLLDHLRPAALLGPGRSPREGDRLTLRLTALDGLRPEGRPGSPAEVRIDFVDREELSRRLQDRMRAVRAVVERALEIVQEQQERTASLRSEIAEGGSVRRPAAALAALASGIERLASSLARIRAVFARAAEAHLVNRLDEAPGMADLEAAFDRWYRDHPDAPAAAPEFYAELVDRRRKGRIGRLDLLDRLLDMFEESHHLLSVTLRRERKAWNHTRAKDPGKAWLPPLAEIHTAEQRAAEGLSRLLVLLEDWNDYQDLVRAARRLKEAQQSLREKLRKESSPAQRKKERR